MSDDFGDFEDFLANLQPGQKITNLIRYRQGGDYDSWPYPGAAKFLVPSFMIQIGCQKWEGASNVTGTKSVTFPQAYLSAPLVLASPISTTPLFMQVTVVPTVVDGRECEFWWWTRFGVTMVMFNWLAIGPVGP